jgi:hypothetical protein
MTGAPRLVAAGVALQVLVLGSADIVAMLDDLQLPLVYKDQSLLLKSFSYQADDVAFHAGLQVAELRIVPISEIS